MYCKLSPALWHTLTRLAIDIIESNTLKQNRGGKDEILMCTDLFPGSKRVSVCRGCGSTPGVFMCFSASAVCSHLVTLVRQSIKWQGPLSHQGACVIADAWMHRNLHLPGEHPRWEGRTHLSHKSQLRPQWQMCFLSQMDHDTVQEAEQ